MKVSKTATIWIDFIRNNLDHSLTTIMLLSFAAGSFCFGWFSDRIGKRKPLIVISVATYTLAWLLFIYAPWSPGADWMGSPPLGMD